MCLLCAWNTAQSVGGRAEPTIGPSETKSMSSAKYGGAWPDKDEVKKLQACQQESK